MFHYYWSEEYNLLYRASLYRDLLNPGSTVCTGDSHLRAWATCGSSRNCRRRRFSSSLSPASAILKNYCFRAFSEMKYVSGIRVNRGRSPSINYAGIELSIVLINKRGNPGRQNSYELMFLNVPKFFWNSI